MPTQILLSDDGLRNALGGKHNRNEKATQLILEKLQQLEDQMTRV